MLNILHIYYRFQMGGSENLTLATILGDAENKHKVLIIQGNTSYQKFIHKKFGVEFINLHIRSNSFLNLRKWFLLFKTIKMESPDLIHSYMYDASKYSRVIGFLLNIPIVIYIVNTYDKKIIKRGIVNKLLSPLTKTIIACSEDVKKDIIRYDFINKEKIKIINSFAIFDFKKDTKKKIRSSFGLKPKDFLGIYIARLVPQKGHHYLIKALDLCVNIWKLNDIKIILIGDGPMHDLLKKEVEELSLEKHIFFAGQSEDLNPYLTEANFYVDSSIFAGLSVATIKALEAQLPCVLTNVGGAKKLTNNGKFGRLVNPSNALDLAKNIELTYKSAPLKINNAQYKYAFKHFSHIYAVKEIQRIYKGAI